MASFDGTDSAIVTITINGENDVATISGDNAGAMNEGDAGDSGTLNVADVDDGEAVFVTDSVSGSYGDFTIDANGNWSYNRTADLESMNAGDVLTDSFTVASADGTASQQVTITISGENDDPVATVEIRCIEETATPIPSPFSDAANNIPRQPHIGPPPPGSGYSLKYFEVRRYGVTATSDDGNTRIQVGAWKVFNNFQ